MAMWGKGGEEKGVQLITGLVTKLQETLNNADLQNWEITLKGYLEASTGLLPGGKAGFEASLTLKKGD